jgi:hypothetical protein
MCPRCALPAHRPAHRARNTSLLVPKPSTGEGCQRRSALDPGQGVRECPLASTAVGGDCLSWLLSLIGPVASQTGGVGSIPHPALTSAP